MVENRIAITYTIKHGGAAKGFIEFLKERENLDSIQIITSDWKCSRINFIKSRINAFLTRILQFFLYKKYVKCSINYLPIIDLAKFDHAKIYIGWVGNGMINLKNNPLSEYIVRFSDEWWLTDIQHYKVNKRLYFPSILKAKINFLNKKNVTIIFPSEWLKQNFMRILDDKRLICHTTVVRNVASQDFFVEAKVNVQRMYFVASKLSDPNKGFHILNDNVSVLKSYFDEIFIVGSRQNIKEVEGLNFLGHLKADELTRRFQDGGVYLHLAERDNSPNSLIEACSSGLIPIVMGGSGAQEYVEGIDFKVPLILDANGDLGDQIELILNELNACTDKDLEDLVLNIQKNIRGICRINDSSNY